MAESNGTTQLDESAAEVNDAAPCLCASELKAQGNHAYQQQDVEAAVGLWNRAIRQHLEDMQGSASGPPVLSQESLELERSIYLNLAQGYLKLGEPEKALRACQVVIHEHPTDVKARYRGAEACLAMKNFDQAVKLCEGLLSDDPSHSEAAKLKQKVQLYRRTDEKKKRDVAKRMVAGASGFSDDRQIKTLACSDEFAKISKFDAATISHGCEIADACAKAARDREAKRDAGPSLPEPTVTDLDSFRAKIMARTNKYNAFTDKSRKDRERAQQSVKLNWLRSGENGAGFDGFVSPLREELHEIEEAQTHTQKDGRELSESGDEGDTVELEDASLTHAGGMEEMD